MKLIVKAEDGTENRMLKFLKKREKQTGWCLFLKKYRYRYLLGLVLLLVFAFTCLYQRQKDSLHLLNQVEFYRYSSPLFYTRTGQANLVTHEGRILLFATGEEVAVPRNGQYLATLDRNRGKLYLVDQARGERQALAESVHSFKWLNSGKGIFYFKQTGMTRGENIGDYFYFDVVTKENYLIGNKIFQQGFQFAATGDVVLYRQVLPDETGLTEEVRWLQHHLDTDEKLVYDVTNADLFSLHIGYQGKSVFFLSKDKTRGGLSLLYYPKPHQQPVQMEISGSEQILRYLYIFSDRSGDEGFVQLEKERWIFDGTSDLEHVFDQSLHWQIDTSRIFQAAYTEKFGLGIYDWHFEEKTYLPWFAQVESSEEEERTLWYFKPDAKGDAFTLHSGFWTLPDDVKIFRFMARNIALADIGGNPYALHFSENGQVEKQALFVQQREILRKAWTPPQGQLFFVASGGAIYAWDREVIAKLLTNQENVHLFAESHKMIDHWSAKDDKAIVFSADGSFIYYLNENKDFCMSVFDKKTKKWEVTVLAKDVDSFIALNLKEKRFILARNVRENPGEQTVCEIVLWEEGEITPINSATYYPLPNFYFNYLPA